MAGLVDEVETSLVPFGSSSFSSSLGSFTVCVSTSFALACIFKLLLLINWVLHNRSLRLLGVNASFETWQLQRGAEINVFMLSTF